MPRKPTRIPGVTVRQRGTAWQAQVRAGKDPRTGKYIYHCATANTEALAWEVGCRMLGEAEVQKAAHVDPTRQPLAEYLEGWMGRKTEEGLTPKTLYEYGLVISNQIKPRLGSIPLNELSSRDVQSWQDTPSRPPLPRPALPGLRWHTGCCGPLWAMPSGWV